MSFKLNAITAARRLAAIVACVAPAVSWAGTFPPLIDLADLDPANGGDGGIGVLLEAQMPDGFNGSAVAGAGDINGDGFADVIVGSPADDSFVCQTCAAFVMFGGSDLGASFDMLEDPVLSDGAAGFIFKSPTNQNQAGAAVSAIGDFNADGFEDFGIGAPDAKTGGVSHAGEAYVLFGRNSGFPPAFDSSDLFAANGGDGSQGFVLLGQENDFAAESVSGHCDFNADGVADLVVGGPGTGGEPGRVYVVFGHAGAFEPDFALARLLPPNGGDGSEGVVLEGVGGDGAGMAVTCRGDANGVGIADILLGAPGADTGLVNVASAYLVLGHAMPFPATLSLANFYPDNGGDGSAGSIIKGALGDFVLGPSVAFAGDVNGDGIDDMLLGDPYAPPGAQVGRAFVLFGRADGFPAEVDLTELYPGGGGDGSEGFVVRGSNQGDNAGHVAGIGDVNDDGLADFVVGARRANPIAGDLAEGAGHVIFGRTSGFPPEFELRSLLPVNGGDGTEGFVIAGAAPLDEAARAVGAAGDVNGDGVPDLLLGAPRASNGDADDAGEAYVVFGRPTDDDGDGVPSRADNCSALANADQRDTDGDGFGNACDADLDGDCVVNFNDLGMLASLFFTTDPDADFNGDGSVNFVDLGVMKAGFFLPPGPTGLPNACE